MQGMRESGRAIQIANTIVETAKQCNLDRDIDLPTEDAADLDQEVRASARFCVCVWLCASMSALCTLCGGRQHRSLARRQPERIFDPMRS